MHIKGHFEWVAPAATINPAPAVLVRVWRVALDLDSAEMDRASSLLSSDEKARAARFVFAVHRRRFVAARAALREILGDQLAVPPGDMAFHYTAEGKPLLNGAPDLHFNVAHSSDLCLIAVAWNTRLGIDIEATMVNGVQVDEVARSFHPAEQQALAALDPVGRERAFYRCWVRKEALLKALGIGLGGGLDRFNVSVDDEARLIESDPALAAASEWTLVALDGAGYAAALAIECGPAQPGQVIEGTITPQPVPRQGEPEHPAGLCADLARQGRRWHPALGRRPMSP